MHLATMANWSRFTTMNKPVNDRVHVVNVLGLIVALIAIFLATCFIQSGAYACAVPELIGFGIGAGVWMARIYKADSSELPKV